MGAVPLVLSLDEITTEHRPLVGGKAFPLAELRRAGLPVPGGFCVTAEALRLFLRENRLDAVGSGRAWEEATFPAELEAQLRQALHSSLGGAPVAVRSSAVAEDGREASFAGQFDSYLNVVSFAGLLAAIKDCWLSQCNHRVIGYLRLRGESGGHAGVQMAVLVQEQIRANAAGVLFTLNPLNGDENEMLVEAVWGLGATLVSGEATPQRYVLESETGRIRSFQPAPQGRMVTAAPDGGTSVEPIPEGLREDRILDVEVAQRLARLGEQVQEHFGAPQDIEWARSGDQFLVLQARPISSINYDPGPEQWTSGNYREVMPGFPCPLSVSLSLMSEYGPALADIFRRLYMGRVDPGTQWGRTFFGRPYWNVGAVKRHNAVVPGFNERAFDATVGIEPTYEGDGMVTPWTPRTMLRGIPVLLSLMREYGRCVREARSYCARFDAEVWPRLVDVDVRSLGAKELKSEVLAAIDLHRETNMLAMRVSFLCAQAESDFATLMHWVNSRLPDDEQVPEGDLLTGLAGVRTAAPNADLWDLAQSAMGVPEVVDALAKCLPEAAAEELSACAQGRKFLEAVQEVIERYRFMAEVDEDLLYPRWDENPGFVLRVLQAYVTAEGAVSPRSHVAAQQAVRSRAEARVWSAMKRGWRRFWVWPRCRFRMQLALVRQYVWWREETRVAASRVFYHCRRVFLEQGRRWAEQGLLDQPEDVFMLTREQLLAGLRGHLKREEAQAAVRRYWRTRRLYRNFQPPNTIGRGMKSEGGRSEAGRECYRGVPCSSGVGTGPARVARSLEEATGLRRGEVLVAPYTNPGWTPVLSMANALVIEEGGLLSHGAVVAREFGIPTVLRVERATELLRTGQQLRVDGGLGTVEVLGEC